MKLLNCTTLRIEDFYGSSIPQRYAILSHRWEDDEVTYQEVVQAQGLDQKAGWAKVREACRVALSKDCKYAWVDTCCINKQDFTELTEAINSMFKWYANAAVCLAYLSDVGPGQVPFENSLWFTRGWTLQELIAPSHVEFFDGQWKPIGTRAELCNEIHQHTRIDKEILLCEPSSGGTVKRLLDMIPLARRMSWASGRTTTRDEDIAYSLLGIFGINMPLLYGEGKNAFVRLQTEIVKETNDMTLFAWTWCPTKQGKQSPPDYRGVLATSPREFEGAGDVVLTRDITYNPEYTMTNKGLRIETEISMDGDRIQYLKLGCHREGGGSGKSLGISLQDHGGGVFLRSQPDRLTILNDPDDTRTERMPLYIKKHIETEIGPTVVAENKQVFREAYQFHLHSKTTKQIKVFPGDLWNSQKQMFITRGLDSFDGFVEYGIPGANGRDISVVVVCGFMSPNKEWTCFAAMNGKNREVQKAAVSGDIKTMRMLAIQANQKGKAGYWRLGTQFWTQLSEDGLTLHMHVGNAGPICLVM